MKVAVIDCETTGLTDSDEPITVGVVLTELNSVKVAEPIEIWYGEREPQAPISFDAHLVHGISIKALKGKAIDKSNLEAILRRADIVVAHNARFDARMLNKLVPCLDMSWRCSLRQLRSFPDFGGANLDRICSSFSINRPVPHNALSDSEALLSAINMRTGKTTRSKTYIARLVELPAWPVFPTREPFLTLESTDGIVFSSIEEKVLLEAPVGTDVRLWSNDNIDFVVGYARMNGYCGSQGEMFRFKKSDNPEISARVGKGVFYEVLAYHGLKVILAPSGA